MLYSDKATKNDIITQTRQSAYLSLIMIYSQIYFLSDEYINSILIDNISSCPVANMKYVMFLFLIVHGNGIGGYLSVTYIGEN